MPGKIVVTEYLSLDGVMEDPVGMESSGLGDWTGPFHRFPEGDKFKIEELFNAHALLFGRTTYQAFAAAWPTIKDETGYAKRMNSMPKYVASTTLASATWTNSRVLGADLEDEVRALTQTISGEILIFGSASIVWQLMAKRFISEYRLMIYPTVLGRGKRLFPDQVKSRMAMTECREFADGIVLLRYRSV